jgi:DNA-binding transcriptional MerR regulator
MIENRNDEYFEEVLIGPDVPLFTTTVVSRIIAIPVWTLKRLDKEGIVCPFRDHEGQTRLYSKRQLSLVKTCWYYLKIHNVKMNGLKVIIEMEQGTFHRRGEG